MVACQGVKVFRRIQISPNVTVFSPLYSGSSAVLNTKYPKFYFALGAVFEASLSIWHWVFAHTHQFMVTGRSSVCRGFGIQATDAGPATRSFCSVLTAAFSRKLRTLHARTQVRLSETKRSRKKKKKKRWKMCNELDKQLALMLQNHDYLL